MTSRNWTCGRWTASATAVTRASPPACCPTSRGERCRYRAILLVSTPRLYAEPDPSRCPHLRGLLRIFQDHADELPPRGCSACPVQGRVQSIDLGGPYGSHTRHGQASRFGQGLRIHHGGFGAGVLLPSVGVRVVHVAARRPGRDVPDGAGSEGPARRERAGGLVTCRQESLSPQAFLPDSMRWDWANAWSRRSPRSATKSRRRFSGKQFRICSRDAI